MWTIQSGKTKNSHSSHRSLSQLKNFVKTAVLHLLYQKPCFHEFNFSSKCVRIQCSVRKNQKSTLTEKIFRQINYLVISIVKPLLSRNFCEKSVRENFYNFHIVAEQIPPYVKITELYSLLVYDRNRSFGRSFGQFRPK